ncbi:hypothetical protein IO405_001523 [Campylobacter lari]|nr:hypothetical protein [Campylobacter lari]
MLNFILDLGFEYFFLIFVIWVLFVCLFESLSRKIMLILLSLGLIFIACIPFLITIPDKEFIDSLRKNNVKVIKNLSYRGYTQDGATLGFGICKRNNYNGKVCNEYLKYVIAKLQKEHQEKLKKEQEKLQKEQIKLKEKNENIKKITDEYFLIQK